MEIERPIVDSRGKCRFAVMTLVFSFFLSFFLPSCASNKASREPATPGLATKDREQVQQVREMNERIMMSHVPSKRTTFQDYKIGPDDLLEISVFEDEKLNKTVRVSSQGNINLPLIGILNVKGLTGGELEKEVRTFLAEKYLKDPHVSVFIKEYRNQRISVMGAVAKPGVYDFTGQKTVLDLLAVSGGLRDDAGRLLFVIRAPSSMESSSKSSKETLGEDQKPQTFIVGLEELLIKGDPNMNVALVHGDVVNVPPAGKVFVGGEVRSPGGFSLTKQMNLSQAITVAGGLTPKADGSETRIFRYSGRGDAKEVLTVDVYSLQKGQREDLFLRENDVVFVPKSGTKTVMYEFWDLVKGRIMGFPVLW